MSEGVFETYFNISEPKHPLWVLKHMFKLDGK